MRHGRFAVALALLTLITFTLAQTPDDEPSPDEAREKAVAERFRKVLDGNPRRGTALDKLYGYHVERGTLDALVAEYAKRAATDGNAALVAGLLESQRGRDAAAVAAYKQAEAALPNNAMPSYYLGQSLVLLGQPDAAAQAFERAISRKPARPDLLDAFQALGRVYQRSQRTDQALGVWNRLEALYPDDARVQDQIATTLVEEGQFEQALPRLVKLADGSDDAYRKTTLKLDIADLKVRLKRTPDALADFEKVAGDLNPDSWLARDVRRRIEEVFLRNDDLAGLAKYYEGWLLKHPADIDATARLAKHLAAQGRGPDARTWLQKGLAAAPTHRGLRQALIEQFVAESNYAAASKEYEALDKADPNNPDTLREWGRLLNRDTNKPEAERRAAAVAVWRKMLDKKPNDPVMTAQVADLLRTAAATDEAVALYRKAIDLAPNAAQYREYLGEYLHSLQRSADALAAWRPIAEGANRNAKNLARLAEVFAGFGYRAEAITALTDALSLDADDFGLRMTQAELLHQEGRNPEALEQIARAGKMVSSPEEAEQVLAAEIKVYQATDALAEQIDTLHKELDAAPAAAADRWLRLARLYEANRQLDRATVAVNAAIAKDAKSIPAMIAAARITEAAGDLLAAAAANRKLAALDRRYRSEYLTAVAKLEQRLGRRDQALQAGRDLLAASPGNPEVYKFFADLCFQLGDADEGLEALRRSVRANPSDPAGLMTLAAALSERVRSGEAIELLWRAFEKTAELEGKLGIIDRIAQLYLENNQFDRLLERLERERREAEKAREMTLCIAQALTTAGDLGTARTQLERLLAENTRDPHLLGQLATLCETEGDAAAATKYQRQLVAVTPTNSDNQLKLAQLLTRTGEADEAADIWVKLVATEGEPHRNLAAIDSLIGAGKHDAALAVLTRMLARKPGDWELLYREGATLMAKGKPADAVQRFAALLALKLPDDELGAIAKDRIAKAKKQATAVKPAAGPGNPYAAMRYDTSGQPQLVRRTNNFSQVRYAVGLETRNYYGGSGGPQAHAPSDYGEARAACLGWQYEAARPKDQHEAFAQQLKAARDKAGADPRPVWDWYYFQLLRQEHTDVLATALTLSRGADPAGQVAYLNALGDSRSRGGVRVVRRSNRGDNKDTTPPLPADQLAHALTCFQQLQKSKPEWAANAAGTLMVELKRAKRDADEQAIYRDLLASANTVARVERALRVAAERKDAAACTDLFARLERLQPPAKTSAALAQLPTRQVAGALQQLTGKLAEEKKLPETRAVLDLYLSTARRQNLATPRSASNARKSQSGGTNVQTMTAAGYYRNNQLTFPTPNDYYDSNSIGMLYTAFDQHKKADLLSDLFGHVRKQHDGATGAEKLYAQLALGYLHWWADEKDEALAKLAEAVQAAPGDFDLVFEVAGLREQTNDFDAALALLDSVTPLDTPTMQRREEQALRVAERTGNLDRARLAADRLFGLRLDADKQLELAGKMHRFGMHATAETVLGRAQRQAGNKSATLARLMSQYQSQNQGDLAVGIARQILRKAPAAPTPQRGGSGDDSYRTQAINVLARSGQLTELIERAEAQLKASPKSVQAHQALVGYYQAANDKPKLRATLTAMAALKPDDAKLRYQVAQQLEQSGERGAAVDQYKAAIKLDPSLVSNNYYNLENLFTRENRFDELGKLVDEIDVRKIGQYYYATQLVGNLIQSETGREIGLRLFKKVWAAFPDARAYMLNDFDDNSVWQLPEMYDYAKQALVPKDGGEIDPWQGLGDFMQSSGNGRVESIVSRLLVAARKQQRLPELRADLTAALDKRPDWHGGRALLAVVDIQSGEKERGKAAWRAVFDTPQGDIPGNARFILTQELEFYAGVEELALKTLEGGLEDLFKDGDTRFSYGPARRLVWWYRQLGRQDDARKLLVRFAESTPADPGYNSPGYAQYMMIETGVSAAQELLTIGEPIEAARIFNRLLADKDLFTQSTQYSSGQYEQQIEQGLRQALTTLKPSKLPAAVGVLLTPRKPTPTDPSALDLVMVIESRDLPKAALGSLLAGALKSTEKLPDVRRDALAKVADLVAKHPNDLAVAVTAVLVADTDAARATAVDRLDTLAAAAPLEALPANGKANARQRAAAMLHVPLWLAAREALAPGRDALRPAGERLAERAAAAAGRQADPLWRMAILREWGQRCLDRGDKAAAEKLWGELLQLAAPASSGTRVSAATISTPVSTITFAPAVAVAPAAPVMVTTGTFALAPAVSPTAAPGRPKGNAPLTAEQFQHAYQVALMAADKGLPALSLRAVREAVRGGPPLPPEQSRRGGGGYRQKTVNGVQYLIAEDQRAPAGVDKALATLVPKWRAAGVPPADVYAVALAAMLPDARPSEVFLYGDAKVYNNVYVMQNGGWTPTTEPIEGEAADRGLVGVLAKAALDAGKGDDLRAKLEARAKQSLAELPAHVALLTLAVEAKDAPRVAAAVAALGERAKRDATQGTGEQIAAAVGPLLADAAYADAAAPVALKVAENFAAGAGSSSAAEMRFKLAEYHLTRRNEAAARDQFKVVEGFAKAGGRGAYNPHPALARQYLKVGWTADAMKSVGVVTDGTHGGNRTDPRAAARRGDARYDEFPRLARALMALPAAERYTLLAAWTLPTADRKSVRHVVGDVPKDVPPAPFAALPPLPAGPTSTAVLLAQAARDAGKADELLVALDKAAEAKAENAETVRVLTHLTLGTGARAEPLAKAFAAAVVERLRTKPTEQQANNRRYSRRYGYDEDEDGPPPYRPSELLFAELCLNDPALVPLVEPLLAGVVAVVQNTGENGPLARVSAARDRLAAVTAKRPAAFAAATPPRWQPGDKHAAWYGQDGYLTASAGEKLSFLLADAPLAGTFELAADVWLDGWGSGAIGYAGTLVQPAADGSQPGVWTVGTAQAVAGRLETGRRNRFARLTVQAAPGTVRYLIDGKLVYEDAAAPANAPWPMLSAPNGQRPVYRNPTLTGSPEVPAAVTLFNGDALDGWQTNVYAASVPQRLWDKKVAEDKAAGVVNRYRSYDSDDAADPAKPPEYGWWAKGGELFGRKADRPGPAASPSALQYFRAMRPGEAVRYEFFHEPGQTHVHPTLGRVAFLVEPDGVKLRWLVDPANDDWADVKLDHAVAADKREPVTLKANDWNAATLAATADGATLAVNGAVVYSGKLPAVVGERFGLYHDRAKTGVRVRGLTLTGPWSKEAGPWTFAAPAGDAVTAKARRARLGESYFASEAPDVLARTATLAPAERARALAEWVLPTDARPVFQLAGVSTPRDVLGVVDKPDQPAGRRVMLGGRFEAPCLAMVAAAKAAGTLDDLAKRITDAASAAEDDGFRRARLALVAAVRAAQGRDAEAADALKALAAIAVPADAPLMDRWPDIIAATATLDRPALRAAALELAEAGNTVIDKATADKRPLEGQGQWLRLFRGVRATLELAGRPTAELQHWASLPGVSSAGRTQGWGVPTWAVRDDAVVHYPGHDQDALMLRTPLRGDFTVTARVAVGDGKAAQVRYAGYHVEIDPEGKKVRVAEAGRRDGPATPMDPPLKPDADGTLPMTLTVKAGTLTVSLAGREVLSRRVGPAPEPWLALLAPHGSTAAVRGLAISGSPTVPERIDLLAAGGLSAWQAYGATQITADDEDDDDSPRYRGGVGGGWVVRGEELHSPGRTPEPPDGKPAPPRGFPEAALYYRRPLLEDAAVEYEFFYDPGKALAHPALDRLVFRLDPEGVRLHWLTDGASDTSGVPMDNAADEPGNRRGALTLKPKAWNAAKLSVAGDTVTVAVNGTVVYERQIEPTNQRLFGVFHEADRTEARVRSVVLTGDWPKAVPMAELLAPAKK